MTLTIHNTTKLVTLNGVAVDENLPAEQLEQFERELQAVLPPTPEIAAIPARLLM